MTPEERQKRIAQLYQMPVNVLIELVVKLEEDVAETRDLRKRISAIRNLATDPEERRGKGRPRKESIE